MSRGAKVEHGGTDRGGGPRPDLRPDPNDRLSRVNYVHLYRDAREVLDMKISSYFRRTMLFTDELTQGNISLKIMNVTLEDEGRYRCFIPKLKSRKKSSIIHLIVDPNIKTATEMPEVLFTPNKTNETDGKGVLFSWMTVVLPVVFCVFIILCAGIGGYIYAQHVKVSQSRNQETASKLGCLTRWYYPFIFPESVRLV
ncbi:CD276 antigen-like [Pholidichthys leucotaenia]